MKRAIAVLALVAMLVVQLSGGISNYYCDCTGEAVLTFDEHCHGDHEDDHDHAPLGHQHHDDGEDDDHHDELVDSDSHHHHELVKTPTDAVPPMVAAAPAHCLQPVLWLEIPELIAAPAKEPCLVLQPPRDNSGPPSLPLFVVRSVVFLI